MSALIRTEEILRDAHAALPRPELISRLDYIFDVDPQGFDSLVVYITLAAGASLDPEEQRVIESALRLAVKNRSDYDIYFRWRTEEEVAETARTKSGLVDQLRSVSLTTTRAA